MRRRTQAAAKIVIPLHSCNQNGAEGYAAFCGLGEGLGGAGLSFDDGRFLGSSWNGRGTARGVGHGYLSFIHSHAFTFTPAPGRHTDTDWINTRLI